MYIVLYKNFNVKSWMCAGPYETSEIAMAVFLNGLPKVCEGQIFTINKIAAALGLTKMPFL